MTAKGTIGRCADWTSASCAAWLFLGLHRFHAGTLLLVLRAPGAAAGLADLSEDHASRRRLEHVGDGELDLFVEVRAPVLHDDHRAVVEEADALRLLLAGLD